MSNSTHLLNVAKLNERLDEIEAVIKSLSDAEIIEAIRRYAARQQAFKAMAEALLFYLDSESTTTECDKKAKAALKQAEPFLDEPHD